MPAFLQGMIEQLARLGRLGHAGRGGRDRRDQAESTQLDYLSHDPQRLDLQRLARRVVGA